MSDKQLRPRLSDSVVRQLAEGLGVTTSCVREWRRRGMPAHEGLDASRRWLVAQPCRTSQVRVRDRAAAALGVNTLDAPMTTAGESAASAPAAPPASPAIAKTPLRDLAQMDLDALWDRLPQKVRGMPPKDAYEWLRVLKLSHQLDADAADRISRAQAIQMLAQRAQHLRTTLLSVPRKVRHLVSDEAFAAIGREIRLALETYAAPEGYLDRLATEESLAEAAAL